MKKLFPIFLVFVMIFLLCSCGLTVTETDNTKTEIETTASVSTTAEVTTTTATEKEKTTTTSKKEKTSQTEKSEKKTEKSTTKKTTSKKQITCTVEISCENILKNKDMLNENKASFVPQNGYILKPVKLTVEEGSTAFDIIKKACEKNICTDGCNFCKKSGIHLDYIFTPGYDSYYIRGIHQLYEKDCGTQSGWMYCVNGDFPNYGCNQYKVQDGDKISFLYTCDMGDDLGAV